jgi:copper chaperone
MQFELATPTPDAATLAAALRPLDSDMKIAFDAARGRLEVIGSATTTQVLAVLQAIGCVAQSLEHEVHVSGGSTCCGGCG